MPYKVFFVEDEIITREGIRDNVDLNFVVKLLTGKWLCRSCAWPSPMY